jgi:hypothetical protein
MICHTGILWEQDFDFFYIEQFTNMQRIESIVVYIKYIIYNCKQIWDHASEHTLPFVSERLI